MIRILPQRGLSTGSALAGAFGLLEREFPELSGPLDRIELSAPRS
ncbi:hypothetical protein [Streptomyces sp. NPDC093795]